jgi:hypothetical protein
MKNFLKNMGLVYDGGENPSEVKETPKEKSKTEGSQPVKRSGLFSPVDNPPKTGQVVGEVSEEIYQKINDAIEKANLPGRIVETMHIDLPERNRDIKRTKRFLDYTNYLEDRMMNLKK